MMMLDLRLSIVNVFNLSFVVDCVYCCCYSYIIHFIVQYTVYTHVVKLKSTIQTAKNLKGESDG